MSKELKDKMIEGFKKALELTKKGDSLSKYGDDNQYNVEVEFNDNDETFSLETDEIDVDVDKVETKYSLSFGEIRVELTKKEYEKLVEKFEGVNKVFENKKEKKAIEKLDQLINI